MSRSASWNTALNMDRHDEFFLTTQERVALAISRLPTLTKNEIPLDDACPICLISLSSIYEGRSQDEGTLVGLTAQPISLSGVTKLDGCGHVFCRVDLIEWIRGRHGTCPSCRNLFADIRPVSESDNESSDGDYVPGEDEDEEEDDGFLDTDGFTDADEFEFEVDEMDLDLSEDLDAEVDADADAWDGGDEDEGMGNWGLSDGDGSESLSEGDLFISGEDEVVSADNAEVFDGDSITPTHDNTAPHESK